MKLKKIASLALAGVMAVSMLAGCATTKPETKPEEPTETSSISKEVGALIKDVPAYVTFAADTKLDSALKTAVEYAGVMDVMPQYVKYDTLHEVDPKIYDKMGIEAQTWYTMIGSQKALEKAENDSKDGYTTPTVTATEMWVVSGAIGENAVKQQIANKLASSVQGYQYAVKNSKGTVGGNFNFNYTVSVSTCTKTVNSTGVGSVAGGAVDSWLGSAAGVVGGSVSAANPTVTFVAVQVVRTATHQ